MLLCVQDAVQTIIEMNEYEFNSRVSTRTHISLEWRMRPLNTHFNIALEERERARESEFNERVLLNNKLNYILETKEITSERTKNENRKCICSTLSTG